MAFSSIPDSLIQVGKAVTRTLFSTYIKDSFDDHESRINLLEGAAGKIIVLDEIIYNAASFSSTQGLAVYRAASAYSLTDCKVAIYTKSPITAGILEIDIKKSSSTDFTSAVSVFTTKPSINFGTASDYAESTNAVFDLTNQVIAAGDYLRLDITSMPSTGGTLGKFNVYLIGEAS